MKFITVNRQPSTVNRQPSTLKLYLADFFLCIYFIKIKLFNASLKIYLRYVL